MDSVRQVRGSGCISERLGQPALEGQCRNTGGEAKVPRASFLQHMYILWVTTQSDQSITCCSSSSQLRSHAKERDSLRRLSLPVSLSLSGHISALAPPLTNHCAATASGQQRAATRGMATTEDVAERLRESKPPATDRFTYLTIIDKSLSPEILPALQEILEDVELTSDIGWDLVEMLITVRGSEDCLESIARLGNPREVILKVLQVMDTTAGEGENGAEGNKAFVTLCGMLGILHKRLQVKAPSRFLHTTLDTVYRSYDPTSAEATAAVIALVRSMSGQKRPPLPTRQSSTRLDTPFQESDPSRSAPDPEANKSDQLNDDEPEVMQLLLQSFITCVIEAYVNSNSLEWASRLLEYTYPERIVPGRKTMMQAFKEVEELQARDALVGQLVVRLPHKQ